MIQFKRTAFIVFTSLTPFTAAFGKSNSRKCHRSLKAASAHSNSSNGLTIEAVLIASKPVADNKAQKEVTAPVVLYKDGTACLDIKLLSTDDDIKTIQAEHPEDFGTWKYNSDHDVELRSTLPGLGGLPTIQRVDALPQGFRLEHRYTSLGVKAIADDEIESAFNDYQFLEDGTFFAGDSVENASANFKGESVNPAEHGRYLIDGYTIQLVFDDGHVEDKTLVADSADNSVIWIDGETFVDQE